VTDDLNDRRDRQPADLLVKFAISSSSVGLSVGQHRPLVLGPL
jgi:hypothetical protein